MRTPPFSESANQIIGTIVLVLALVCALGLPVLLSPLLRSGRLAVLATILAVSFGIATGYLGAWFQAYDESRGDYHFNHIYQIVSLLVLPSSGAFSGIDFQATEVWSYRHSIAIGNGIFWLLFSFLIAYPIHMFRIGRARRHS